MWSARPAAVPPGLDYIVAFFGCLYAGAIPVPVYPPDPARLHRTIGRLQSIVADAQATVALTTEAMLSMATLLFGQAPDLAGLRWRATDTLVQSIGRPAGPAPSDWRDPDIQGDSLAFLQYTSGSTGAPNRFPQATAALAPGNLALWSDREPPFRRAALHPARPALL